MNSSNMNKQPVRVIKDRKENGIELRKTHFMLGTDGHQFDSQYRRDFPTHVSKTDNANMDSVTLRKTHFKLGDHKTGYNTSLMEQNKNIEPSRARSVVTLDPSVKNDLTRSHFILGNFDANYTTIFRSEFNNKKDMPINNSSTLNSKTIEKSLRSHNYVLGNDVPDYKSESQAKYVLPNRLLSQNEKKISSAELQKSHYIFGNNGDSWTTTSASCYYPKTSTNKKVVVESTKTALVLGQFKNDFRSVHHETFVPHEYTKSNEIKELSQDLRKHHFVFGNENEGDSMTSMQRQEYTDHKNTVPGHKLNSKGLRASHFSLGDKSQAPVDQYETTYGSTMVIRPGLGERGRFNQNWTTSVVINPDTKATFNTETQSNYGYKLNPISEKEIKQMKGVINDIRGHHFNLGEIKNDFGTTTGATFKQYDAKTANSAKGILNESVKTDLKATHYKLGYLPNNNQTTHNSTYIPVAFQKSIPHDPKLRQSSIKINPGHRNVFDAKTIYMMDFDNKEAMV